MNTYIYPIRILEIPKIRDLFGSDPLEIVAVQVEEQNGLNGKPFKPLTMVAETRDGRRLERRLEQNIIDILNQEIRNL